MQLFNLNIDVTVLGCSDLLPWKENAIQYFFNSFLMASLFFSLRCSEKLNQPSHRVGSCSSYLVVENIYHILWQITQSIFMLIILCWKLFTTKTSEIFLLAGEHSHSKKSDSLMFFFFKKKTTKLNIQRTDYFR